MTGEELKAYIKNSGMSVSEIARELDTSPQNITAKFGRKSVKMDFLSKVEAIIDRCCPPLPAEMNTAVMGNVASYANVHQSAGASAATEVKFLREQNARLQDQIEALTKQISARDEQVGSLIKQVEHLTQKLTDMLPAK